MRSRQLTGFVSLPFAIGRNTRQSASRGHKLWVTCHTPSIYIHSYNRENAYKVGHSGVGVTLVILEGLFTRLSEQHSWVTRA